MKRDTKTCDEGAEKLQSIVRSDEKSRRTGSSGGIVLFPKMKGDDKNHIEESNHVHVVRGNILEL